MSRIDDLRELLGEIDRHKTASARIQAALQRLVRDDLPAIGKNTTTSVAAAGLIENHYTAMETVLFRISQNFGNSLSPDRWHSDLLQRMAITIPEVRPAVISEPTLSMLDELMRFRHSKRYYFQLDYDWARLEYLIALVDRITPVFDGELRQFERFLLSLVATLDSEM